MADFFTDAVMRVRQQNEQKNQPVYLRLAQQTQTASQPQNESRPATQATQSLIRAPWQTVAQTAFNAPTQVSTPLLDNAVGNTGTNAAAGGTTALSRVFNSAEGRTSDFGDYGDILTRADYGELSKPGESKWRGAWDIFGDARYNYINNMGDTREIFDAQQAIGEGPEHAKYSFMTDEERGIYNYLYATEGKKAANEFLKYLDPQLNRQMYSGQEAVGTEEATKNPLNEALYSVGGALAAPVRGVGSMLALAQDVGRTVTGRGIDPYSPLLTPSRIVKAEQAEISGEMEEKYGVAGRMIYNAAMSGLENLSNMAVGSAIGGGAGLSGAALNNLVSNTSSLLMSSEGAALAIAEAKEKGYSDLGALSLGIARGAISYAIEKVGMDFLFDGMKVGPRNLLKNLLRAAGAEAAEEVTENWADRTLDLIVDGLFDTQESSLNNMARYYAAGNGTAWQRENPEMAALLSAFLEDLESAGTAALSAAGSTTGGYITNTVSINNTAKELNATPEAVYDVMAKYDIQNGQAIQAIVDMAQVENVQELDEFLGTERLIRELNDRAMQEQGRQEQSQTQFAQQEAQQETAAPQTAPQSEAQAVVEAQTETLTNDERIELLNKLESLTRLADQYRIRADKENEAFIREQIKEVQRQLMGDTAPVSTQTETETAEPEIAPPVNSSEAKYRQNAQQMEELRNRYNAVRAQMQEARAAGTDVDYNVIYHDLLDIQSQRDALGADAEVAQTELEYVQAQLDIAEAEYMAHMQSNDDAFDYQAQLEKIKQYQSQLQQMSQEAAAREAAAAEQADINRQSAEQEPPQGQAGPESLTVDETQTENRTRRTAKKDILDLFHVPQGYRAEAGSLIDAAIDEILETGRLNEETAQALFDQLAEVGQFVLPAAEEYRAIREDLKGRRIYVSDVTKANLQDYKALRRQAFGAGIILTSNPRDVSADVLNMELAENYGESMFPTDANEADILENIIDAAVRGKNGVQSYLDAVQQEARGRGNMAREIMEDDYQRMISLLTSVVKQQGLPEAVSIIRAAQTQNQTEQNRTSEPQTPSVQTVQPNAQPGTEGTRLSQTVQTTRDSGVTTEDFRKLINKDIKKGEYRYIPISNEQSVETAMQTITSLGWDGAYGKWSSDVSHGVAGDQMSALGALLYNHALETDNFDLASDVLLNMTVLGRHTARGLQAMKILDSLSPVTRLAAIEKQIEKLSRKFSEEAISKRKEGNIERRLDKINEEYGAKTKSGKIELSEELRNEYLSARSEAERNAVYTKMVKEVAAQIPANWRDKFTALRYLNMLGNLRTQGRNLLGNTAMTALYSAKNTTQNILERIAKIFNPDYQMQTSMFASRDLVREAKADYKENAEWVNGDQKYNDSQEKGFIGDVMDQRTIFGQGDRNDPAWDALSKTLGRGLEWYRRATNTAMTKGDTVFIGARYARALAGYLQANGMDAKTFAGIRDGSITATAEQQSLIDKAREYAAQEAQEATFHDSNEISDWVSKLGRGEKTPKAVKAIAEGVLPFRKTPANVAVRAWEFSPAGLVSNAVSSAVDAAKGNFDSGKFLGQLSKNLTGTGLFFLGMWLRRMGWLSGHEDDDEQKAFNDLQGKQEYALNINGGSYTLDWVAPSSIPLFMGVNMADAMADGGLSFEDLGQVWSAMTDPMLEMSMLQGLNDLIQDIGYNKDSGLLNIGLSAMLNLVTQYGTNTLLGQFERGLQGERTTTFTDADTQFGKNLQRNLGSAANKIPFWDYNQIEYVDAWGRTQQNTGLLWQLLSPGYSSSDRSEDVDGELQALYDRGQTNVFPQRAPQSTKLPVYDEHGVKTGERNMTADEYVRYLKLRGQTSLEMVRELINSDVYDSLTDEAKADAISAIYSYAAHQAAMDIEPSTKDDDAAISVLSNIPAYYAVRAAVSNATSNEFNRDTDSMDRVLEEFSALPEDVQTYMLKHVNGLRHVYEASEAGIDSAEFYRVYDAVGALTPAPGYTNVAGWQQVGAAAEANISDEDKDFFMTTMYFKDGSVDKYNACREAGYTPYDISEFYRIMQTTKGDDRNGDGRSDSGTKKNNVIAAAVERGFSQKAAEQLYNFWN